MSDQKRVFQHLPKDVIPTLYTINIQPDFKKLTFKGSESINITVVSETCAIVLNAFEINVTEANLTEKDSGKSKVPDINHQECDEKVVFQFSDAIKPGEFILTLEFTGLLNDQLRGLYRNKYVTATGEELYGAGTHFEATGARRAYPCWDEPAIKAKFVFTLTVPNDLLALSNMPVEVEKPCPDRPDHKVVQFQPTPTMSTYLTAMVVGQYDCVEDVTCGGVAVRVFTPVGKKEQGRFALEVATKALSYYESYFEVPYGLPKIDLITLSEFPIGAMENWGLVTYRETCLLWDSVNSSANQQQRVALVVAHELSHNWFGNLVTPSWWTDLWLKEGFAQWMEHLCVDHLYPEMNVWTSFINGEQSYALKLDALASSHPVEVEVGHPSEIDEIFDGISYSKGACLIHMLQSHLGAEAFRKGMKLYLQRHQFSSACTKDMWAALSAASGQNVDTLMAGWTGQMGFPLIKVEELPSTDPHKRELRLTQEKFTSQAPGPDTAKSPALWQVPYSVVTSASPDKPTAKGVLSEKSRDISVPLCAPGNWYWVNQGQVSLYHVQYPPDALKSLVPALGVLSPADRLGLMTDLSALSRANYMQAVDVLRLTINYRQETDSAVCCKLASVLGDYGGLIEQHSPGNSKYSQFVCDSLRDIGARVGWDAKPGEGFGNKLVREGVLTRLGVSGDPAVKAEAFRRFKGYCEGEVKLPGDIKAPVYATVLSHGGKDVFDQMLKLYADENSSEERNRIGRLLGCVKEEALIQDVLMFSLSDSVKSQDTVGVLSGMRASLVGRRALWVFVQANWGELHRRYSTSTMLAGLVKVLTEGLGCANQAADIEKFFKKHEAKSAERAIQQGLEHIAANVAFIKAQGESICQFLQIDP